MRPEDYITREGSLVRTTIIPCLSFSGREKVFMFGTWKENDILISCPAIPP